MRYALKFSATRITIAGGQPDIVEDMPALECGTYKEHNLTY